MSESKDLCVVCKYFNKSYCKMEDNGEYKHSQHAGINSAKVVDCPHYEKKVSKKGISSPRLGSFQTHPSYRLDYIDPLNRLY